MHAGLLAWGAFRVSPTVDETAYLAAGVSHWHFGRFDLASVSPPLVRLTAAVPVCLASPKVDWSNYRVGVGVRSAHSVGSKFVSVNGRESFRLFTLARFACIPFSLIGASACYCWSLRLWGQRSAFVALLLWCTAPNVLAHGQLMTPDIGVTALSVAAAWLFHACSRRPTWPRVLAAGGVLGFAILAKTNAVVLIGVLPAMALVAAFRQSSTPNSMRRITFRMAISVLAAVYVLNLGYGFEGSFRRLDRYQFVSAIFCGETKDESTGAGNRFAGSFMGRLPVPLPRSFLEGIDLQRLDFENEKGRAKTYFRGEWYDHGWWWYYFYVVAVKIPVGAWVLLATAIVVQSRQGGLRGFFEPDVLFVVVPGAALFALACSQTGFGHSLRYVLPAFPFAFVFAGGAVRNGVRNRVVVTVASIGLACHVAGSLSVYPHSLSYFNLPAGGPTRGHAHLLDGNLDWGQDLLYVEEWLNAHPEARPRHVAYWGFLPLHALDMEFSDFKFEPNDSAENTGESNVPSGWYVISVNNLRGDYRRSNRQYRSFLNRKPRDMAGYSTYIYYVPPDGG